MKAPYIEKNNNISLEVGKESNNLKVSLQKANELKKQGNLVEAIKFCNDILNNHPDSFPVLRQLGSIYQAQRNFDEAVKVYQQALAIWPKGVGVYFSLANVFHKQGKMDEAISAYEQVIKLKPNFSIQVYLNLAKILENQGKADEAISNYAKALEVVNPDNYDDYLTLAAIYAKKDLLDDAIACYKKAIEIKSDLPFAVYQSLAEVLQRQGRAEEALALLDSLKERIKSSPEGKTYLEIWQALNQTTIASLEKDNTNNYPHEFIHNQVSDYFQQISQYKIINLESISDEEQSFIENSGLSIEYLQLNHRLVTQKGASFHQKEKGKPIKIEQLVLDEGYIYAVCPSTGKVLKSNHSLLTPFSESPLYSGNVFYRFVGNEVFYVLCCDQLTKIYIYFPRIDLVVQFKTKYKIRKYEPSKRELSELKAFSVANWTKMKAYITNSDQTKKVPLLPTITRSPWHQVYNFLAPVQVLIENGYLPKIEKFYQIHNGGAKIFDYSCYGFFEEIFPEISFAKIKRSELAIKALENNFFVFNIKFEAASQYISDALAERIYQTSLNKCAPSIVAEVTEAKKNCFPLLWIGFRTHQRTWLSKVEGIANIVNNLAKSFPNIGVVFDGFTRTEIDGELFASSAEEKNIKQEKQVLSQIQALLAQEIKVYDIIGCPMSEVILWSQASDFYLAPIGSGLIKIRLPNKPGVVHSSTSYGQLTGHRTMRENYIEPATVPPTQIIQKLQPGEKKVNSSYDFDWQIAYEELLKIASSLKRDS